MAPVLALISYGITGYFQPTIKQKQGDYKLNLAGQCRPSDNSCVMKSGEFEIMLISTVKKGKSQLGILSNQPVAYLSIALASENNEFIQFRIMKSENKKYWQVALNNEQELTDYSSFRLAVNVKESNYFIEEKMKL
jgi:hypothetical protein